MIRFLTSKQTLASLAILALSAATTVVSYAASNEEAPTATGAKVTEPASPDFAAEVLDLRTFPRLEGASVSSLHTMAMLMYEAKATPKAAFDFQRKELTRLGFKEMPGGYSDENNLSGHFSKDNFSVAVSASPAFSDPKKVGWASVTLVNRGNVDLDRLPTPPNVKPFDTSVHEACYTTTTSVPDTAAACRKLLLDAGWEPYGQMGENANQPDMTMQYFKKNAIKLQSWVMKTPVDGGKTLIRYSTELMAADLPAPADATDPRYDDSNKKLDFAEPLEKKDAILAFYTERLPKMGWKATTDKPITDDRDKTLFLIFRNEKKDLLSLDMKEYTDSVQVSLSHQTKAEVDESERLAKINAEKRRLEEMERNRQIIVSVPIPANAAKLEQNEDNLFEFTLPTGSGPATLKAWQTHFRKEGWTEEEGSEFGKTTGDVNFTKEKKKYRIGLRYFDIGFGTVDFTVSAPKNVIFKPIGATPNKAVGKTAANKGKATKAMKKPGIPGLPELPEGVELPAEVNDLLEEAQKEVDAVTPAPKKKR